MLRRLSISLLVFALASPIIVAQPQAAQPSATPRSGRQKSLFDFYASSQNSRRIDYGQSIEEWRKVAIANTFQSFDFWVAMLSLGLSGVLFLYIVYLAEKRRQTVVNTTQLTAKYHHQLATGQRAYQCLQEEHAKFLNVFEIEKEPKLSAKPPAPKLRNANEIRGDGADQAAKSPAGQLEPASQGDGVPQQNALVASLRNQIVAIKQRLEQEQEKNRKLRGE